MANQKGRSNGAKFRFGPESELPSHTCWSFPRQTVQSLGRILWSIHKQTLLFWSFWRCYKPSSFCRRESGPIIVLGKSESLGSGLDVGMKGPQLVTASKKDTTISPTLLTGPTCNLIYLCTQTCVMCSYMQLLDSISACFSVGWINPTQVVMILNPA